MTRTMGLAVIGGASSRICAIYSDRLAKRGYDFLLVARDRQQMDVPAKRLVADMGRGCEPGAASHLSGKQPADRYAIVHKAG